VNLKLLFAPTPATNRMMLKLLGVVILVSGLGAASCIWLAQDRLDRQRNAEGANMTEPIPPEDSRRYTHDVELYYGATGLLVDKWERWFEQWTRGRPLAKLIGATSIILAAGLFYGGANRRRPTGLPGSGS
jgi:hypothetical protein